MNMANRKCIICGGDVFRELLTLENMPAVAQNMPGKKELEDDKPMELPLCQCEKCGLVQFLVDPVYYYKDVIRAGGGTTTMRKLRHSEYKRLLQTMREKKILGRSIVEVGCGRGEFLSMWSDLDDEDTDKLDLMGIENFEELVNIGVSNGLDIRRNFAEDRHVYSDKKFDAFVQFNFLEHQPHPGDMLRNIWMNLEDKALGLVTVPSFEYIIENDGYYELMRDHIAYYTVETLNYLFDNNGFKVLDSSIVNRDTIELMVEKTTIPEEGDLPVEIKEVDVTNLKANFKLINDVIKKHVRELNSTGKKIAIWGASHQTFTLAATTDLNRKASYIIDSADFKQGKYSPVSHLKIVSSDYFFEEPVDEILIVAPGYTDEIAGIIRKKFGDKVRILTLMDKSIKEYCTGEVL